MRERGITNEDGEGCCLESISRATFQFASGGLHLGCIASLSLEGFLEMGRGLLCAPEGLVDLKGKEMCDGTFVGINVHQGGRERERAPCLAPHGTM